ncbi:hypothetical protein [Pseudarthrobacter sp. N5]|uniref:hypothetical protein n=1 Tax=Pseudarthrobacter sp. N5 TaxID=3418416 RepID=UPI003CE67827
MSTTTAPEAVQTMSSPADPMTQEQREAFAAYVLSLRTDWPQYPIRARIERMSQEDGLSPHAVHTTVLNAVFKHPGAELREFDRNFHRRGSGQFRSGGGDA